MNIVNKSVLTIIASTLLLSAAAQAGDSVEVQILAEADQYAAAWNRGDAAFIDATHHPSYILVTSDGPITLEQRIASVEGMLDASEDRGTLSFHDMVVRPLGGEHALAYGRAVLEKSDGSSMSVWFTSIYALTVDGWKAIHDHG